MEPQIQIATDYLGHDAVYRRLRAQGRNGWDEEASLQQTLAAMESVLSDVPMPKSPTMIELGCGAGDLSLYFATKGFRVMGLDIAPYAVEWAREKAAQAGIAATFTVADVTRDLDPLPEPADFVLDGHCLHCIIGVDRKVFLRNARRCLKSGGLFHINTMCGDPAPPVDKGFDPVSRNVISQGVARRYLGKPESIVAEVLEAGFRIERQRVIPTQYVGDMDCLMLNVRRCD
jgi:cyclopropane fatty-acyl-phospholipid synthase-like methyltransferase